MNPDQHPDNRVCSCKQGCCGSADGTPHDSPVTLARREFLRVIGAGLAVSTSGIGLMAGPFEASDFEKLIPADKKLSPEWIRSLTERGDPAVYRGKDLAMIGMPVGGLCAGQVYLGGDGRLWCWDIFNLTQNSGGSGPHYAQPMRPESPAMQGFALRVRRGGAEQVRTLDCAGFRDVSFQGQYPIGLVTYRDPDVPVEVRLEAFSPFIPLNVEESSLPVVVMQYTVRNTSGERAEVDLAGWIENPVCLRSAELADGVRTNRVIRREHSLQLECAAEARGSARSDRPPTVFASFDENGYGEWKVNGEAFGTRPASGATSPEQYLKGQQGAGLVNSYARSDVPKGRLVSPAFVIDRPFIRFLVGGGDHPGQTCMNLVVDGRIVRTQSGFNTDALRWVDWNVRALKGKSGHFEIVDDRGDGWGHIDIDQIEFADSPRAVVGSLEEQPDFGTMSLAIVEPGNSRAVAHVAGASPVDMFGVSASAADRAVLPFGQPLRGAVVRSLSLEPGQEAMTSFAIAWRFPNLRLDGFKEKVGRHYATRFASAAEVVEHVAGSLTTLAEQTRLWRATWYDSTLPHWFLDRTFANTSTLATSTSHRFASGRFYGWEGVGCCGGTCTHVWHYAHAVARLFPSLEQSTREAVDLGIAFDPATGMIDHRAELHSGPAIDGQAGCILRAYREHQMSPDDAFLKRNWPRVRQAIEYLIGLDMDDDGLLEGGQHNTLDSAWFGPVAWLSSLYLASLRAGEEMACEVGDQAFAARARGIFDRGRRRLIEVLWNGEYFIHRPDPAHPEAVRSANGCEIDQVFGQSWAMQVGLGRVIDAEHAHGALKALWKYNFTPDVGPFRKANARGRWYAMPGEGGLVMCTFPQGGAAEAGGSQNSGFAGYFNECMSGFEWQVAGHMIWEGLVTEGLAIARAIHDRYHPSRRNPWNEVECGDHYARAMASYGAYLAACGYEYHGPKGHIGFAPRLTPERFRAAFTAAEGWGTYAQQRDRDTLKSTIAVKWGRLRLRTVSVSPVRRGELPPVRVRIGDRDLACTGHPEEDRLLISLNEDIILQAGEVMEVVVG